MLNSAPSIPCFNDLELSKDYKKLEPSDLHEHFRLNIWRLMMRFATWQANRNAYSSIDDPNLMSVICAPVHITSVDLGLAICKFRILLSKSLKGGIELQVATNNMKRAYRQVSIRNDHLKFLVIAIW